MESQSTKMNWAAFCPAFCPALKGLRSTLLHAFCPALRPHLLAPPRAPPRNRSALLQKKGVLHRRFGQGPAPRVLHPPMVVREGCGDLAPGICEPWCSTQDVLTRSTARGVGEFLHSRFTGMFILKFKDLNLKLERHISH